MLKSTYKKEKTSARINDKIGTKIQIGDLVVGTICKVDWPNGVKHESSRMVIGAVLDFGKIIKTTDYSDVFGKMYGDYKRRQYFIYVKQLMNGKHSRLDPKQTLVVKDLEARLVLTKLKK